MVKKGEIYSVCFLGGTRYYQPLDETLAKKFHSLSDKGKLFVVGFSTDLKLRIFGQHARFYLLPLLPIPMLRYLLMFTIGLILVLWCIFQHRVRILVAQSPYEGFIAALAKQAAQVLGYKVTLIVESHGDFIEGVFLYRKIMFERLYRFLMRYIAMYSLRHADCLRAVSVSTSEQLKLLVPGKPIFLFPAWTDMDMFFDTQKSLSTYNPYSILYAGVLIPIKGVHYLISAFSKIVTEFPTAKLTLVGKTENLEYAYGLENMVESLNLKERVIFLGEVSQKDLSHYMHKSAVFVLPSVSEGLGRVIFEAMACGLPVIGSRIGGITELIDDGVTGFLVPQGDEKDLADRLRWLLSNPEEARAMGKRARASARKIFSTEAYVNNYVRIFEAAKDIVSYKQWKDV